MRVSTTTTLIASATATLALCTTGANAAAETPQCRPLGEIYSDGKDLCENMWGEAFTYVPTTNQTAYDLAYTMWWFTEDNPNDAVTARRVESDLHDVGYDNIDVCHLQSGHKAKPGPEPDTFTECHPWKENSCCTDEDDYSAKVLKELYGAKYHWDKCGKLSQECERFFVMEACFYQCDANAGLFRYTKPADYDPAKDDGYEHTEWRMKGMPIKGDFCDSWMTACRHDMFCADESQGFFTCPLEQVIEPEETCKDAKVLIIVLSTLAGIVVLFSCCLVRREVKGVPVFAPLGKEDKYDSDDGQIPSAIAQAAIQTSPA